MFFANPLIEFAEICIIWKLSDVECFPRLFTGQHRKVKNTSVVGKCQVPEAHISYYLKKKRRKTYVLIGYTNLKDTLVLKSNLQNL